MVSSLWGLQSLETHITAAQAVSWDLGFTPNPLIGDAAIPFGVVGTSPSLGQAARYAAIVQERREITFSSLMARISAVTALGDQS